MEALYIMSIPNQIEAIISKRKENLPKIDKVLINIQKCKDAVYKLEEFQNTYSKDDDFGVALKKIDTEKFNKACRSYTDRLMSLKSRLDRNELHISFVGRARQGKSLVMQKISGLGGDVIPAAKGSDCTGAKSIITNSSNAKVEAEIQFFSQLEIVNIVNTYLRSIFADTVGFVNSIDDIKNLSKSTLEPKIPTASSSAQEQFKHLVKYIEHISEVEKQLGSKIIISSNEIESYVAQYNHSDNSQKYYKYLGVKEANIKCKFPCSDAGKIVLVDTIGIGATSLGVVESMNETIKNDSDAIVLMFRPDELGPKISTDETEAIDNISKLVSEEYARLMLFWVINKRSGLDEAYNQSINEIMDSINKRNHPISKALLVDCADESEVNDNLLLPVLEQLSEKILDADKILIESVKGDEDKCSEEWTKLNDAISDLLLLNGTDDFKKILSIKVQDTFDKGVLNDIRTLTFKDLGDIKDKSCDEFESEIVERLKDIFREIPKEDSIRDYAKMGTKEAMDVWNHFAALFRNKIIDDFYKVDIKLDEIVNKMKLKVIEILASPNKGCLCNLVPLNKTGCANEWISEIKKYINERDYPHLYAALEKFKSFTIKTDGFVISKVRIALEPIDPKYIDKNKKIKKYVPTLTHTLSGEDEQVALSDEIVGYFNQYASDIKGKISEEMKKLYSIPNESMWAAVYDLYDRLAFAKEDENQYFGIKEEWKTLYEKNFNKIFPSEYEKLSNMQGFSAEWKQIACTIKNLAKNETFKIGM